MRLKAQDESVSDKRGAGLIENANTSEFIEKDIRVTVTDL